MKGLILTIRLNSLYSVRIPFTWQSSLTYPILPPSSIIGILANVLQRYKNDKDPLHYLNIVEKKVFWCGSHLLSSCIIKSYITSAVVKWEINVGGKCTNALGREYAFSKELALMFLFNNDYDEISIEEIRNAFLNSPIFCGDNESLATVISIIEKDVEECEKEKIGEKITTSFPVEFEKISLEEGISGIFFLMHKRLKKSEDKKDSFPLTMYLCPLIKKDNILYPTLIDIPTKVLKKDARIFKFDFNNYIIV